MKSFLFSRPALWSTWSHSASSEFKGMLKQIHSKLWGSALRHHSLSELFIPQGEIQVTQNLTAACQGTPLPAHVPSDAKRAFLVVVASSCPSPGVWTSALGCKGSRVTYPVEKRLMAHLWQVEGHTKTGVTGLNGDKEVNKTEFGQVAGKW